MIYIVIVVTLIIAVNSSTFDEQARQIKSNDLYLSFSIFKVIIFMVLMMIIFSITNINIPQLSSSA